MAVTPLSKVLPSANFHVFITIMLLQNIRSLENAFTTLIFPRRFHRQADSGGLRQAFIVDKHCSDHWPQKVYGVFCRQEVHYFVTVMWLMMWFPWQCPPSGKQRPLIKAALTLFQPTWCQIFLIARQSWYCWNALHIHNSELEIGYAKSTSQVSWQKNPWNMPKQQLIINSTNSPALKKRWGPSLHPDYEGCMTAFHIYQR